MAQDNIKNLYDALKSDYDLGSEDDFRNSLKDANNRRNLYKAIEGDYDLGSEQDFEKALGYGNRVNETNEANKANTTTNTQQRNFTQEEYGRLSPTAQEVAQGVGVAPNNGPNKPNETKGADKANVQERKPRVQFVPEASNVKGFTVAKDSPLRRQYPFLDQLGDDEQAFFKTDTNEPLYAWKDSEGKDITPDEAATLNQRADIEQNDAIRPHQVPVTSLYFARGANAGGVKTDKSVAGYVDSLIKQQYGNDYQDKQWTTEDGRTVSGAELLENMAQETYDQLNNDVKEARIALFEANGDKEAESKINTAMITKWQGVMSDKRMLETLHDENAMKQDVKDYAQGEIDKAREEERRIIEEMNKRGEELDAASSPYVDQTFNTRQVDNRYTFLTTKLNAVRDRIRSWEAVRDSDDYGAMRALKDTAGNLRSWDLGYSDMIKGMHLVFGTEQDKKELANLLGNAERAKNFEQKAISDFARYVQIGGQSLPFMATFVGSGGGFRTLSEGVAKGAVKWAERKALQGIQKNAVKYLGVAAGDILAGYTLSGTLQGMGTLGDIMQRRAGDIEYNTEKGEYELVNPRGWAESAYKGATASMIDNATELLGDHLNIGKAAMKLLPKAGLKQVSDWLTKAGKSELYTTTREWLKRAGINSLGDEILEEEMAIPMNAVFVGDNPLLFGDGGLLDAKTQKDIVFGVGLSVFAMNAAAVSLHGTRQGINALQTMFDKDQRRLDAADIAAIEIIGGHKWTEIKNNIDNATNEELADVAQKIADDKELNEEQKKAAGEYVTSTLQMRGHNLGENAAMQSNEQRDAYLDSVLSPEERQNVHDDGMIHAAVLYPDAQQGSEAQEVFITKGNVVMNADGTIDADASDKEIYYKGADGQAHITSPDKFQSVAQPINVEEYAAANAPQEAQAGYTPGQQVSVNIDGQDIQGEVTNVGEDGNVLVSFENPDGTLSSRWLAPEELEQSNGRIAEGQVVNINVDGQTFQATVQGTDGNGNVSVYYQDANGMDRPATFTIDEIRNANRPNNEEPPAGGAGAVVENAEPNGTNEPNASQTAEDRMPIDVSEYFGNAEEAMATAKDIIQNGEVIGTLPDGSVQMQKDGFVVTLMPDGNGGMNVTGIERTGNNTPQNIPENGNIGAKNIPQNGENYSLSDKVAGNGERFYQDNNGNIDLVKIPQEVFTGIGYTAAPFRLTPSMIQHMINRHGRETGISNEQEAIDFVMDVMTNFDHVRLGYDGALIFSIEDGRSRTGKRAVTVLINSDNGEFYGLKTSGYEAIKGLEKRPLLWERGANEKASSTDAASASVPTGKSPISGGQSGSASHQSNSLSGSKDNANNPNLQGYSGENGNYGRTGSAERAGMPTDEKGNPRYQDVPVEATIADLYDGSLNDEEVQGFIDANIADAQKKYDSVQKKAPKIGTNKAKYLEQKRKWQADVDEAKRVLDYWNEVNNAKESLTHTTPQEIEAAQAELSGQAAREEYAVMNENVPANPVAVASDFIRGAKITPESFKAETGYGTGEQRRFVGMIASAENGGKSIDRLAEDLVSYDNAELGGIMYQGDTSAAKDAILEALQSAGTRGELTTDNTAEQERYVEARRAELDAQYMEAYGMTYEDYLAYEEQNLPEMLRKYANFDEVEFYNLYANEIEQSLNARINEQGNDTAGEEPRTGGGNEVQPGEETGNVRGSEGGTEQGTEVPAGVQGTVEDGAVRANTGGERVPSDERGRQGDLRHTSGRQQDNLETPEERVRLSDEIDENGRQFVLTSNGQLEFGVIEERSGLTPAPILLSEGIITNPATNDGYGLVHIEARHGDQIRQAGYKSVLDFIEQVAKNYERIKEGSIRRGHQTYMLQLKDKHNNTLMVELSSDGNYWNINTAGIFKETYGKNRKEVYSRHTTAKQSAETVEASQEVEQSGTQTSSSMNAPASLKSQEVSLHPNTQVEESVPLNETNRPTITDNQPALLGINSSDFSNGKDTEKSAVTQTIGEKVAQAEAETEQNPTEGQKEAGNYKKGHVRIGQFDITVENPKGSVRRGTDQNGNSWETTMHNTYGYIRGTEGVDGDHIDVFLTDDIDGWNGRRVYVVDQYNEDGTFDEHKVMLGFNDEDDAREAYFSNYSDDWANKRKIVMTSANLEDFEKWINSSHRKTKPFAEYKSVNGTTESNESAGRTGRTGKAARIEKLRNSKPVMATGEEYKGKYELNNKAAADYINKHLKGEYVNKDTGTPIKITRKGAFKVTRHDAENEAHLKSVALIPQMIENAIFIHEEQNDKGNNKFDSYRYYVTGLNMGGVDYTVKLTVGVKNGETYYDHALTEIEKSNLIDRIDEISSSFTGNKAAPISKSKDKRLISILQTNDGENENNGRTGSSGKAGNKIEMKGLTDEAHELFSDIIAQSTHNIEINDSGVSETDNTLYAPIKVDGNDTNLSLFQEEPAHSSGEPIVGVSFYRDGMTYQEAADLSDEYNKYVGERVCADGSDELAINFGSIDEAVRFEEWLNDNGGVRFREAEDDSTHKQRQLEIINDTNPMLDDYHTGIRSEDDIKTMREAIEEARSEAEKYGDETWSAYPDITNEMLDEALRSGKITVYSSKPIVNGNFVTPSRMQASDYAGGGRIYSKTVNIDDVAWINTDEGQYANTDNDANGNIRFRFIGEQGAARLDAAEEATTRLDNLSTARRMEQAYNDKKARIDKLRDSKTVEITGEEIEPSDDLKQYKKNALEYGKKLQGNYVNKDTGITIQLQRGRRNGGINEVLQHDYKDVEHLQSVAAIPQIIENSIYIDSRENTDKEKNPNVAEYQYYVCGLKIGNTDYTVRSTIAVDNKGNRYYDHKLTSIEKGKLLDQINGQTAKNVGFGTTPGTKPTTDNGEVLNPEIQKSGNTSDYKDKRLISLLQTNDQENARKIKLATGWERGADGKWRYETPDFEYHPNGDARQNDKYKESDWYKELYDLEERLFNGETLTDEETKRFDELAARENEIRDNEKNTERIYLDDYVKDDELFNAYPELKQTRVDFVDLPNEEYSAKYNSEENRITVNQAKSMDVKSVLAHEIQHAIQRIEGFASGSNTDSYRNAATSENVIADINAATGGRLVESGGFNNTPEGIFDALNRKTTYGTILRDNSTELDEVARKYGYETIFDLVNDIGKFKSSVEMYRSEAGEVEARNVQERLNMTPEQRRNTLAEETEDVAREDQQFLQDAIGTSESLASTEQSNDIDTAVADTANKLNVGVRVVHSVDEVGDEGVRRAIEKGRNVKGWYDTRTGEIVVYAPNATDADDAVRTVLHEGVAHYGLRQLVGDENFDTFLDNIYNNVDGEIKAAIDEKAQRNGWSTRVATEEYLASLAEDTNFEAARSSGLWQRIKDFFMDLLTKAGIRLNEALTDNELRYILWRSYENLQEPNGRGTIGTVRDVAMQGRLGVGNYGNEDMRLREAEDEQTPEKKSENKYRELYDKRVSRRRARLNRSYFDSMQPVKVLQKTITEETGQQIRPEENVYLQENRANSMAQRKHEMWERGHMEPARREVTKLMQQIMGGNWLTRRFKLPKTRRNAYNAVVRYMKSKHGLENNEYRRNMEAEAAREPFEAEIGAVEKLVKDGNISRAEADKRQAELKEQADKAETESRAKTLNKDYSGLQGIYGKDFERKAKEYVEDFEGAYDTAPLWREWNGATKAILEEEYKSGLLSKELYDRIRNMYKYYIPLKGWAENRAEDVYTYYATGSGDGGKPHRREGRTSESDDPLVTLEQDADRQFTAAARNRTKQALYNLATAHKSSLLTVRRQWYQNMGTKENPDWQRKDPEIPENATPEQMEQIIKDFEKDMRKLEKEGTAMRQKKPMILPYHATKSMEKEHTVRVMVNGKEYVIYVNGNPAAAQAVNGTSTPQDPDGSVLKRIYGALRWINRVKASLLTAVNVNFIPGNLVRDAQYSIQNMKAKEPVGYVLKYVKNLGEGMAKMTSARLFYKDKKGTLNMDDKTERLFKEFLDNGGETGYTARYTLEKQRRRNMAAINRMTGIDWLAGLRMLQHSLEYVNRSVETIVRFAAYKTSREAGRSIAQSINDAKEASVNFDKHGSGELGNKEWRLAYIFSNVGFQALRRLLENASGHPVRFTLAQIERFALGFAVPMMAKALLDSDGDDDEKDAYEALPEWMRESGLAVPVSPILRKVGADDAADKVKRVFLYLPLGPEDKIWYALGENTWHLFNKDNITEEEAMDMAVKFGSLAADLLPLDFQGYGGNPIVSLAPTPVQDFVALEQNVNYWGQPIYRESTNYNEHDPGHRLAFTGTPEWYVERAEDINRLTGGDEYTKGWLSPKPEQIEYFINQTGGGVTRVVNQVMSLIERAGEDGNKDIQVLKNVPVVSSLVKKADVQDGNDGFDREKYYDYIDEYEKALHDYNAYRKAKRNGDDEAGQKAEKLKESPTGERMDIIRKDIRKIRNKDKQVRRIDEKENPTAEEEARRDKLKTESNELKQKLLEKLDKVKEKPGKQ